MTLLDDVRVRQKTHGQSSVGFRCDEKVPRVAIRAWSAHTAFGDLRATWEALLCGRFIDDHTRCENVRGQRRCAQLARVVARDAAGDLHDDAALVVGTSKGSVEDWLDGSVSADGLADVARDVADALRLRGLRLTVTAACASGLHALARGALMIRSGEAGQVLVVAAEASVHPLFLGSFQRLGVLAKPGEGCRPFDRNRSGFYMSDAAAAVLLEASDDSGDAPGAIHLDRFALGGDATHLTGGDPRLSTLRHLLARVVDGRAVDLVHAHGTGTPTNDEAELAAIESVLEDRTPHAALYSHKGALGHSLGAAGLLSVVINCQAHASGTVPPNVRTREPLPTTRVTLSQELVRRPIRRSVVAAAGFGGATAAVGLVSD
jgi:3-oxoacyl-[acyl-carrier-protein] synthase II